MANQQQGQQQKQDRDMGRNDQNTGRQDDSRGMQQGQGDDRTTGSRGEDTRKM